MSDKKYDPRTPEERLADLEERRKTHVLMTSSEAEEWNNSQPMNPVSPKHWSVKAARIKHVLGMGHLWKRLAKSLLSDLRESQSHAAEWESIAEGLQRQMVYCDNCSAGPGEECAFSCTRDGTREVD